MAVKVNLNGTYKPSEEIVAREVQGEFIIIPLTGGVGNLEDELFSLNQTGKAIWDKLNGKKTLKEISAELAKEYASSGAKVEKDVLGITAELLKRKMLVEAKKN
jgi:hypothetical protein